MRTSINGPLGCYIRGYGAFPDEWEVASYKKGKVSQRKKEKKTRKKKTSVPWIIICPAPAPAPAPLAFFFLSFLDFYAFAIYSFSRFISRKDLDDVGRYFYLFLFLLYLLFIFLSGIGGHPERPWLAHILLTGSVLRSDLYFFFMIFYYQYYFLSLEDLKTHNDLARKKLTHTHTVHTEDNCKKLYSQSRLYVSRGRPEVNVPFVIDSTRLFLFIQADFGAPLYERSSWNESKSVF